MKIIMLRTSYKARKAQENNKSIVWERSSCRQINACVGYQFIKHGRTTTEDAWNAKTGHLHLTY